MMTEEVHISVGITVSHLRISRRFLKFILEESGKMLGSYCKAEYIWISSKGIPHYLCIEPYEIPEAFGGKMGYRIRSCSPGCSSVQIFGGPEVFAICRWLYSEFEMVNVP